MDIAPGIHNVITERAPAVGVTNTYLVVGSEGAIWVDTGWDREGEAQARLDYWRGVGRPPLEGIVVTHRHPPHWGNAPAMQRVTGAPIIALRWREPPSRSAWRAPGWTGSWRTQILSHLAKLENEGRVSASGERFTCLNRS